jgi:hypothetical protein
MTPYLIGLIAADGHNAGTYWVITMIETDRELLDRIAEKCDGARISVQRSRRGAFGKTPICRLQKTSKSDCELLDSCGVPVGNKYHTLSFPDQKDDFLWEYLCGYFDGDGTICCEGGGRHPRVELISNHSWCEACKSFLSGFGIQSFIHVDKRCADVASVVIRRRNHVHSFMERIYAASSIRLRRKEEKWAMLARKQPRIKERVFLTAAQRKTVEDEIVKGTSVSELHRRFGLSKTSLTKIKRELLGSRKKRMDALASRASELFGSGLSITEVCRQTPCSYYLAKKVSDELEK